MAKYKVYNVTYGYEQYPYCVIRDCRNAEYSPGYWFYGSYKDLETCSRVCSNEIRNGVIAKMEDIEPLSMSNW